MGGTEIERGFNLLNEVMNEEVKKNRKNFTIIFASDGGDNN